MKAKRTVKSYDLFSGYNWYVPGTGGMFVLLALFLLGAVISNVISLILTLISAEMTQTYGMLIVYPVMFIPAMMYASYKSKQNSLFETGYALDSKNFGQFSGFSIALAVSIATLALAFIMDGISGLLPPIPESLKQVFEQLMDGPVWVSLISVSVFAPFFEEWLCRGMILRGLMQKIKPVWAIIISALFFAFIHMNPWQAIPAFALGVLFGYVYYKTGSLKLTMLMHCVNNTFAVLMGQIDAFKNAESFYQVLNPVNYACIIALCILMTVFFVFRMRSISLPLGQSNACEVIRADEADDPANE